MTAHELIGSGLLEAYVLGQASAEEAGVVRRMAAAHAEVRAEIDAIEQALEDHAMARAQPPPADLRNRVMQAIAPATDPKVSPIQPAEVARRGGGWNWLAAAAVIAFVLSAGMNFMLYRQLSDVRGQLTQIQSERAVLAEEMRVQRASLEQAQIELAVMMDPHKRMVPLAGQAADPTASARVFWDDATHELYFQVVSLPTAPPGKQYQLWAQVDGQMVDAGMLDNDSTARIHRMKDMANATAFGVTLENEGGSATPTLSALYLLGGG